MNKEIKMENIIALANEGYHKKEIASRLGYENYAAFYQKMRKAFLLNPDDYTNLKKQFQSNEKNLTHKQIDQSVSNLNVKKKLTPLKLNIDIILDLINEVKIKDEILEYFHYNNSIEFFKDLKKVCNNNELYKSICSKIKYNKGIKLLELSKTSSLNTIAALLNIAPEKVFSSVKGNFKEEYMYKEFVNNCKHFKVNSQNEIKELPELKLNIADTKSSKRTNKNKKELKKLDIFHSDYIFNLSIQELQNAFDASHMTLIPQSVITIMLEDQSSYHKELTIITKCLEKQPDISDFNLNYNEQNYYTKLALLYQRKGYDVTLYCNVPDIMVDCLFLNIKVKHNHQYSYEALAPKPASTDIHGYDITYLIDKHEDLKTSQPKLICECVLRELLNKHYYNIIYYIVDSNVPENHFIFLRNELAFTFHSDENIIHDTILNAFQFYELSSKSKIVVKSLDFRLRHAARKLGFILEELPDDISIRNAI